MLDSLRRNVNKSGTLSFSRYFIQRSVQDISKMADPQRVANILQGLRALPDSSLSIIRLSEPISATPTLHRTSDVSTSAFDNPSPESLEADLSHYKVHAFPSPVLHTKLSRTSTGTLLKTPLLLPRTGNQREIPPRHRRRPSLNSRTR